MLRGQQHEIHSKLDFGTRGPLGASRWAAQPQASVFSADPRLAVSLHAMKPDAARGLISECWINSSRCTTAPSKRAGPPASCWSLRRALQGARASLRICMDTGIASGNGNKLHQGKKNVLRRILLNSIGSSDAQLRKDKPFMSRFKEAGGQLQTSPLTPLQVPRTW